MHRAASIAPALDALRERHADRRKAAIAAFREHLRPDTLLTSLRRNADQTLRDLVKLHPLPAHATLAAVGGYGRGELFPYSDVDVLVLLRGTASEDDSARIAALIAAMWDLGLEPGHSVRTVADCQQEAASDITVETALLEARWLAGSKDLFKHLRSTMQEQLDVQMFFQAKRAEMQQRHARHQDTPYALEPNCKESPGGLRDLQVLLWLAQAAGLGRSWREIARSDWLMPSEYRSLRRAEQAFKRLRIELHLLAGRREDRVLFDLQPGLARIYGFEPARGRRPSEILMQRYYWAARVVSQLNVILMQSMEERLFPLGEDQTRRIDDDFCIVRGRLGTYREDAFERNPALLFRAFLVMQEHPEIEGTTARTQRAMWHARHRIDAQFRRNPINRRQFLQILQQPRGIVHALRRMTMLNILPRYLPVFRRIVGQMQHDLFHIYTVDQHILMVVRNLRRFTMPEHAQEYPFASQLMASFDSPWLLYVAALFHDIAKGRGGDHSELGAREVRRFCNDHGIERRDKELLVFLVRQHLTMSMVAQKRDLSDPDVVRHFVQVVGNERRLTALYLLTVADIRGTSPKVWNAWKGKLLEDLYRLTLVMLGGPQPDRSTVLEQRKQAAATEIRKMGLRDESRDAFWRELDVAYFLRHDASEIAWHTRHLYYRVASEEPVVKARVVGLNEALQIMVYTRDRRDLFVTMCRYFERRVLSVLDARVHTTRHGWALDSFIVLLPAHDKDYRSNASLVEHELAQALISDEQSGVDVNEASMPRRPGSRRARVFPIVPNVSLQPDERSASWRLSVTASDRPGLLHGMARVFARNRIELKMAKIMTLGDRVEDIFIVEGDILGHPREQLRFERDLLAMLDTR
ncbi:[protein-PII] uridylyltransferase [Allopusillimonas soli]|uniref:Bifunctional uridylyltransferase/uridylyl-removing enzyme n=1 Tax=Allopusillimonas soli TaxID=659016 RepID=A0A853F9M7_9BURK|nr:[protein-PII] uridylyltransferase [Allopusillimonas soli]NYT36677.1 [protein-PII] uridylyltransferase [Allopusillimonas soli]TEA75157.1 [protein-PII] uridylyltransferase [Allopusillimonas soli]